MSTVFAGEPQCLFDFLFSFVLLFAKTLVDLDCPELVMNVGEYSIVVQQTIFVIRYRPHVLIGICFSAPDHQSTRGEWGATALSLVPDRTWTGGSRNWVVGILERVSFNCSGCFAVWTKKQSAADARRPCAGALAHIPVVGKPFDSGGAARTIIFVALKLVLM